MSKKQKPPAHITQRQQELLNAFNARGSRIAKKVSVMTEAVEDLQEKIEDWQKPTAELLNMLLEDKRKLMDENINLIGDIKALEKKIQNKAKQDGEEPEQAPQSSP